MIERVLDKEVSGPYLCFDMALFASLSDDLQFILGQFVVHCKIGTMRISTFKYEAMVLTQKSVKCPKQ